MALQLMKKLFTEKVMSAEERRSVLEDLFVFGKDNQRPYLFRMSVLLVLSTVIATSGLLSDSAAVVIGAMLVAPFMNPVMAAGAAVVMGWPRRFYGALWLVFLMAMGALLLSSLMTLLSPQLVFLPEQVLARTRPTYYDLLIALAAGSAGAYTIVRKESGAIPGVAVAVALLPPLASAGILATSGEFELAVRALVLFLTNWVAMILASALTFILLQISPPKARMQSASFVRKQISLFLALTVAISVPLWFYSDKVLFNARYQAAQSEILQGWLGENNLELADIEIYRESNRIVMALEGPDPPVNIDVLYQGLVGKLNPEAKRALKIEYTWTQKISGAWPQEGATLGEVAEIVRASKGKISGGPWVWTVTQYDAEVAARPGAGERSQLVFETGDRFEVLADCGKWTGKYTYNGRALAVDMNRNWFSGCRRDDLVKIFIEDLGRARAAFIDGNTLEISLADSSGIMYFERK